jgi:CubicO group peptidase (beta-lactamase class C family)
MKCKNVVRRTSAFRVALRIIVIASAMLFWTTGKPYGQASNETTAPLSMPQPKTGNSVPKVNGLGHPMNSEDVGNFFDSIIPMQLQRENIAGAVVIVVKDGGVLFQKGYGYADVEKGSLVTPAGTLFRIGSVSKLFTWTAVMQLVEEGKLDLDRDINSYLDITVPATFSKPITLRTLMTHTPGFEEVLEDLIVTGKKPLPLRRFLSTHMPERVYPPGTTPAYSNYGATIAGYVVERVSGMPFDDYVEKYIFQPLDMGHTTFRQPLPADLQPLVSSGYELGTEKAMPYEVIQVEPAGGATSSAIDISHFMIAHLQNGEYRGFHLLKPQTAELMHPQERASSPAWPEMGLGFYEESRNGHLIFGHGGDTSYFHSDLHLIQDANIGVFISYNSTGRDEIDPREQLFDAFLDRYYPYSPPPTVTYRDTMRDAKLVTGQYISSRRPVTNILSFFGFRGEVTVTARKDGMIVIDGYDFRGINQEQKIWQEVGPLIYREQNGQETIGFVHDTKNRLVIAINYPFNPFLIWTKTSFADSKSFNMFLFKFVASVLLVTPVIWLITAWVRNHYKRPLALNREERFLRLGIRIVICIDLLYLFFWMCLLRYWGDNPFLSSNSNDIMRAVQLVGWVGSFGTLLVLYSVLKTWRAEGEWWVSHIGNVTLGTAAVGFSWFLLRWHLLHFNLRC